MRGKYERKTYDVICSNCGETYQVKQRKKGSLCKPCQKKKDNDLYYQRNKEKVLNSVASYRQNNPEKVKEQQKRYYEENKERLLPQMKEYYEENKEYILERYEQRRRERGEKPNGLSGIEEIVLGYFREWFPNTEIRTRDRKTIRNPQTGAFLELDFYFPELSMAVELNGPTHYKPIFGKEKFERQQRNDEIKREVCKELGIHLIEIPLEEGVHYERSDPQKSKLKNYLFLKFREDKLPEQCLLGVE